MMEKVESETVETGSNTKKKGREWLFQVSREVIIECKAKFDLKASNADRQKWASQIFHGIHECGSLLRDEAEERWKEKELEDEKKRRVELEERVKILEGKHVEQT
ncbi:hypothetical protein MUP01_02405 [Candidatus Bathyarchaeota archaeon]|nr:hypothetical protein [Candidatus Bathyarchaeota archaeon]